jgi:glycosyltransferase involved in cell wall biosynthesis
MQKRIEKPLVSIIIPSFNQGQFIRETIESCLSQDYRPLEILIIDGASKDNTLSVLQEYESVPEVRWVSEPDDGPAYAVNKGFAMAKGEIAGIQASDDAYLPGAVAKAVEEFNTSPKLGLVYAECRNVDVDGNELTCFKSAPYSLENFLSKTSLILQPATFFKMNLARELGGWNSNYFNCDTELWLRMLFRTEAKKIDEIWAIRHMHKEQRNNLVTKIMESNRRMVLNSPDIAKASFRLRRAAKCGMYKTIAEYSSGALNKRLNHWKAFLVFPEIVKKDPKYWAVLIPYYWKMRSFGSQLRQLIAKPIKKMIGM